MSEEERIIEESRKTMQTVWQWIQTNTGADVHEGVSDLILNNLVQIQIHQKSKTK